MKLIITTLVVLFIGTMQAKDFEEAMLNTLAGYADCKSEQDFINLGNRFDRIAKAEADQWLPKYYHAHCYIIASFVSQADADQKDAYIDVAEASIKELEKQVPDEVEVHVLKALMYTARLVVNPAQRGQQYSALSGQSAGKAMKMDPTNLRAQYIQLSNEVGQAQFFGQDLAPYCTRAKALDTAFDTEEVRSEIHPSWGKYDIQRILENCK